MVLLKIAHTNAQVIVGARTIASIHLSTIVGLGLVNKDSTMKELPKEVTNLIAVSDGSVKDSEGSAGYVISDMSNYKNKIEGSLVVDGTSNNMNSYRAELYGILAVMVI